MPELKITVVVPDAGGEGEGKQLDNLMSALASEAGKLAELQRSPGMGQTQGAPRVFTARFSGEDALAALMRGTGGWFMKHGNATITFKIESSKGGKTLQLKNYSSLGMAQAAAAMREYLE